MGQNGWYQTMTEHNKEGIVCIIFGMYCRCECLLYWSLDLDGGNTVDNNCNIFLEENIQILRIFLLYIFLRDLTYDKQAWVSIKAWC